MFNRILLAYDASDLAEHAFSVSLDVAAAAGMSIFAVHAIEPAPPPIVGDPVAGFDPAPITFNTAEEVREERARFEERMQALAAAAEARGVGFESHIDTGRVIDTVVNMAGARDIICVGRKGRFARAGLGSSTRRLVSCAPCPVLIVSGESRLVHRVVGVFDGSSPSKRALAAAQDLAGQAQWTLGVLGVAAGGASEEAMARAHDLAPDAEIITLAENEYDEAALIEHAVTDAGHALLVMGAYPESWLHRLFFGDATAHVLERVGAPVLLVH